MWTRAAAFPSPRDWRIGDWAARSAYVRRERIVSRLLEAERVVGRRMRWEVRDRVARNSSIRRSPVLRPIPLEKAKRQ
jgi:hypothetical protein